MQIIKFKRVVIKIGSHVLVNANGRPLLSRMQHLVDGIMAYKKAGIDVVLVSSGAVAMGVQQLKLKKRPEDLADLQVAASVGQSTLLSTYHELFKPHKQLISQVLLTHDDLKNRSRHLNARNTFNRLLQNNIIPIVNENDTIAVEELQFGDNDQLSALVTGLINAEALIILSTTNGLKDFSKPVQQQRVPLIEKIDAKILSLAVETLDRKLSIGGMASKLKAAKIASQLGAEVRMVDGQQKGVLQKILEGKNPGTRILADAKAQQSRKKWIGFFNRSQGELHVDQGAMEALIKRGKSLLPAGIVKVEGSFQAGSVVDVFGPGKKLIARGLVEYSADECQQLKGKQSKNIDESLKRGKNCYAMHRDNLLVGEL